MKRLLFTLLSCWLLFAACALGETAEDITALCEMRDAKNAPVRCLSDGNYQTRWSVSSSESRLTITAPEGKAIGSVYVQFYNATCPFKVQVKDGEGQWQTQVTCAADYLAEYVALPEGAQQVRIAAVRGAGRLVLAQVHVFAEGEAPQWVQRWEPPLEKADLLVISAHPDDEVLFMGGTIPYYAGERGLDVQVAYLVPATPYRKLELLDGLWLCGETHYPDLGPFPDMYATSISGMYKQSGWSEERALRYVAGLYRRYRPEVVVTHDVNGEYGHGAHKVAADAAQKCIALAADPAWKKTEETEPWQVKKLYLHLYGEGALRMDWRVPLEAFGGKTAFDVAQEAFACHISQQKTDYRMEDFGPYDNALFGLAFTTVGEDEEKNDFLEHIGR